MISADVTIAATTGRGGVGAGETAANAGGDFLEALSQRITEATGKTVTPEALAAWLEGEAPASLPGGAALTRMLGQLVADSALPGEGAQFRESDDGEQAPVDVAALLAMLASVASNDRGTSAQQGVAGDLMARLRERVGVPGCRLLDGLQGRGDGEAATGRFEQLVQTAAPLMNAAPATRQSVGAPTLRVAPPVNSPAFGHAVGEQVVWMVRNEVQRARIQLNPPGLGPLDVSLTLQNDRATVAITAHHAATRDAVSAEAARLRSMLGAQGFASVNVDVSRDGGAGTFGERQMWESPGGAFSGAGEAAETAAPLKAGQGLVDRYA